MLAQTLGRALRFLLGGGAAPGPAQGDAPDAGSRVTSLQAGVCHACRAQRLCPLPSRSDPSAGAGRRSPALSPCGPHRRSWSSPPPPSSLSLCQAPPPPGSPLGLLTTPRPLEGADEGSVLRQLQESPSPHNKGRHVMLSPQNQLPGARQVPQAPASRPDGLSLEPPGCFPDPI